MSHKEKNFYITTTLPYINAEPHIGFAMEIVRADVLARYKTLTGYDVFFNTGTDEHGKKIWESAQKEGVETQAFTDKLSERFKVLKDTLSLYDDVTFIRTTDIYHVQAVQDFWKLVDANGYIYKKNYQAKYCVGCELEKTDSELVDGVCPIHPNRELEIIEEENYFFKFSEFTQPLLDYYELNKDFVRPDFRFEEIKSFVSGGLQDFPISRVKTKMPWGIPVPGDDEQVMYVWFDALVNYISTLNWPLGENFKKFWEEGQTVQIAGKDNLRQQSAMWQAMLMAAGLPPTQTVLINGFLNGPDGRKMSKSLGNVLSPDQVLESLPVDALRFYLVHEVSSFEDSPISLEMIESAYTAHLVNGIGNLTNRIVKMASSYDVSVSLPSSEEVWQDKEFVSSEFHEHMNNFVLQKSLQYIFKEIRELDAFITKEEPFKKIKVDESAAKEDVARLMINLWYIAVLLEPFMPETSQKIQEAVMKREVPETPIFPRLEKK